MSEPAAIVQNAASSVREEAKWRLTQEEEYARFMEIVTELGAHPVGMRSRFMTELCLDSEDGYLRRARCRCLLRSENGRWCLIFREIEDPATEPCVLRVKRMALEGVVSEESAIRYCREQVFPGIHPELEVSPLFTMSNRRESRTLRLPGKLEVVSSLDHIEMVREAEHASAMELELAFAGGAPLEFRTLVEQIEATGELTPQHGSRYDHAARRFGMVEQPPEVLQYRFGYASTLPEAARQIVSTELARIRLSEPAVRVGVYADAIHDMRVACRKIRAAARSFEEAYPANAKPHFDEITWLGKVLGAGRDLEVHTECLTEVVQSMSGQDQALLSDFCDELGRRFELERTKILALLNSERYQAMLTALERIGRAGGDGTPIEPVAELAPRMIRERLARILDRYGTGPHLHDLSDDELHRLRIRLKRIRYLAEFFLHVSPPEIGNLLANTKRVQKLLGLHQDYRVGREMVEQEIEGEADARKSTALMRLLQQVETRKRYYRGEFLATWPEYCRNPTEEPREQTT